MPSSTAKHQAKIARICQRQARLAANAADALAADFWTKQAQRMGHAAMQAAYQR